MYNTKERKSYNEYRQMLCDTLNITLRDYNLLRRIGLKLHRLYEQNCNGVISETNYDTQTEELYATGNAIATRLGLHIFFQTDPRGATIYVDDKPIPNNNYSQTHCIY